MKVNNIGVKERLKRFGLSKSEISTVLSIADKRGKYDDGKFLVIKEKDGYFIELS